MSLRNLLFFACFLIFFISDIIIIFFFFFIRSVVAQIWGDDFMVEYCKHVYDIMT